MEERECLRVEKRENLDGRERGSAYKRDGKIVRKGIKIVSQPILLLHS